MTEEESLSALADPYRQEPDHQAAHELQTFDAEVDKTLAEKR